MFFTLFYPSTSPNASFALISFFLRSLTKAPANNTPAIKITSSSVSLEAMFVTRFVAAALWRGCGQIFVAAASCAIVRNKSLRVSSGLDYTRCQSAINDRLLKLLRSIHDCSRLPSSYGLYADDAGNIVAITKLTRSRTAASESTSSHKELPEVSYPMALLQDLRLRPVMAAVDVCVSVRLSVCPVRDSNSRMN